MKTIWFREHGYLRLPYMKSFRTFPILIDYFYFPSEEVVITFDHYSKKAKYSFSVDPEDIKEAQNASKDLDPIFPPDVYCVKEFEYDDKKIRYLINALKSGDSREKIEKEFDDLDSYAESLKIFPKKHKSSLKRKWSDFCKEWKEISDDFWRGFRYSD